MSEVPLEKHINFQLCALKEAIDKAERQFDRHMISMDAKIRELEAISIKTSFIVSVGTSIIMGILVFLIGNYVSK